MILVFGSIERVKEEMKQKSKQSAEDFKELNRNPALAEQRLSEISVKDPFYMVTKTIPVKVENIVINHLLYNSFIKKLKGFKTSTLIQDNKLIMQYWKPGTSYQGKGSLVLYDISRYYEGFKHIPTGVIVDGA